MTISNRNTITHTDERQFFLGPEKTLHRQYEALRACLLDQTPGREVAQRFGYSPGFLRVLCHQFRHDPAKRDRFFQDVKHGPQSAPARDRVRDMAVAMRKKNLSVYDIQRELAASSHPISINALSTLMREEGFARLPRRRDDERPLTIKPETAAVADVRMLDLSPHLFAPASGDCFSSSR